MNVDELVHLILFILLIVLGVWSTWPLIKHVFRNKDNDIFK